MDIRRRIAIFAFALIWAYTAIGANSVRADAESEAEKHFRAGFALADSEDFAAAAAEYETSIRLFPKKTAYFNLANALKALNRLDEAVETLDELKRRFRDAIDPELKVNIAKTRAKLAELKAVVAELTVRVDPYQALVYRPNHRHKRAGRRDRCHPFKRSIWSRIKPRSRLAYTR